MIRTNKSDATVSINLFCLITNILFTGDSLNYHNNQQFSTKDRDNDEAPSKCALLNYGAFWYKRCTDANLKYLRNGEINRIGVAWLHWKDNWYSMKRLKMKITPN